MRRNASCWPRRRPFLGAVLSKALPRRLEFVVNSMGPDGSTLAFVWTPTDGMKDLNTLIPPNSGLMLIEAFGINNSGQIVGTATDSHGNYHAYVLTPSPRHSGGESCRDFEDLAHVQGDFLYSQTK